MTVSIIIAVKQQQGNLNLEQCLDECRKLDFPDFEILVLPDADSKNENDKNKNRDSYHFRVEGVCPKMVAVPIFKMVAVPIFVPIFPRIIPTGPVSPAQKRDMALGYARGDILAFIDDDAYPDKHWLKNAVINFQDDNIAAVGGPAVTPPEDTLIQDASGRVFSSPLVSGQFIYRYLPKKKRYVDDYPSCNFLVRRSVMQELGGFDTEFWPGEDTKLCLEITKKLGKKIIYDPAVLVYHHRRRLFLPHLRQVAAYALHRGYFVKKFPETSRRLSYFIPTLFLLFIAIGGLLSAFLPYLRSGYTAAVLFYILIVLIFGISAGLRTAVPVCLGIILTHLSYGLFFLKGLLSHKLKEGR